MCPTSARVHAACARTTIVVSGRKGSVKIGDKYDFFLDEEEEEKGGRAR
jgi:hypothetical protein